MHVVEEVVAILQYIILYYIKYMHTYIYTYHMYECTNKYLYNYHEVYINPPEANA
jgi:hypothetical protein